MLQLVFVETTCTTAIRAIGSTNSITADFNPPKKVTSYKLESHRLGTFIFNYGSVSCRVIAQIKKVANPIIKQRDETLGGGKYCF